VDYFTEEQNAKTSYVRHIPLLALMSLCVVSSVTGQISIDVVSECRYDDVVLSYSFAKSRGAIERRDSDKQLLSVFQHLAIGCSHLTSSKMVYSCLSS
jgi:hypothetical protein